MTLHRFLLVFGLLLGGMVLACGAGFGWFVYRATWPTEAPAHVDGIVALTGGAERVETALRLLSQGRADKLLLSGIGGGAELSELAHRSGIDPTPLATRVTIDRAATTTHENAVETAAWAKANNIRSLMVVTAFYHMPRALTELGRALPDVSLYPMPVQPSERHGRQPVPMRIMAEEYLKLLASSLGVSALMPSHDAPHGRAG